MKALIRNPGETVTENDGIVGIDWDTGAPLTNPSWASGPYILVDEYTEPEDAESVDGKAVEGTVTESPSTRSSESEGTVTESPSTVTYGGKEYPLEELKKLIG